MMETKEFWGRDMSEALQAVRESLGADALILETLSVPSADGEDGGERVKVTAFHSPEEQAGAPPPVFRRRGAPREPEATLPLRSSAGSVRGGLDARGWREINTQLADLKTLCCWLIPGMKQSGALSELTAQDVPPELLLQILQEAAGETGDERDRVRRALLRLIPTGGDMETRDEQRACLAFIGPPGTGKTSAVVKLTVHLLRKNDRKIGWVSLDNRRVTGVEELTVYASILGVPCEVAEDAEGLARAIERLSACDVVLIDTPGISPRDAAGLAELAGVLQEQSQLDVRRTLVLSATTNWRDLALWAQRYDRVGYDSLLFSMVDACGCFGPLLNTVLTGDRPLSYLVTGASVTQGIEVARPASVVDLLLP
jgi:flagellar biosynthesis protein FlhF